MILKFNNLQKVGVFKDFSWDQCVKNKKGETVFFDKLNILYGQNYSGKTTLSRIIRSLETGKFSNKYIDAQFSIFFDGEEELTNIHLGNNQYNIRVFNEDFIRDNIEFISDPDKTITPFAILGERNKDIEKEIDRLQKILGDEKLVTGLYAAHKGYRTKYNIYNEDLKNIEKILQKSLAEKATGKEIGIKYKKKFDKIYYDIKALRSDIKIVNSNKFDALTDEQIINSEFLLNENVKDPIKEIQMPLLNFEVLQESVSKVVTKVVGKTDKINSLIKNAILNKWVKEGKSLHAPNSTCGFCNGIISLGRWNELEKHFDEESENLEKEISNLLIQIENEIERLKSFQFYKENSFYNKFRKELNIIQDAIEVLTKEYIISLNILKKQVVTRKNAILEAKDFHYESDKSKSLQDAFENLKYLRHQSNYYGENLKSDKELAKENLRLQDVYEYLKEIRYSDTILRINHLKELLFEIEQDEMSIGYEINNLTLDIWDKMKVKAQKK